jgi:hypothetical protein
MNKHLKRVEDITVADLEVFPVWQYDNTDGPLGETTVHPVQNIPVQNLDGRMVGTRVRLANGVAVWALISNVDSNDPYATQHFLTLSVFKKGKCFHLARYHDVASDKRGPEALAAFLSLPIDEVFPIAYDLSRFSSGERASLVGTIPKEAPEKLSDEQLISLALR